MAGEQERELWVALAELFFLDTRPQDDDFDRVVRLLVAANWTPEQTRTTLVQLIAPHAGQGFGLLAYPGGIGVFHSFFDKADLCQKVQRSSDLRSQHPKWYFFLSDWYCERMLRKLGMERLLTGLADRRVG